MQVRLNSTAHVPAGFILLREQELISETDASRTFCWAMNDFYCYLMLVECYELSLITKIFQGNVNNFERRNE